jgi:hypothetical protein
MILKTNFKEARLAHCIGHHSIRNMESSPHVKELAIQKIIDFLSIRISRNRNRGEIRTQ